jgi:hypothetical protein
MNLTAIAVKASGSRRNWNGVSTKAVPGSKMKIAAPSRAHRLPHQPPIRLLQPAPIFITILKMGMMPVIRHIVRLARMRVAWMSVG